MVHVGSVWYRLVKFIQLFFGTGLYLVQVGIVLVGLILFGTRKFSLAQAPLNFFRGGGGGAFQLQEASLGQISILKIIIFLMIFLSFFGIFILCCFIE